MGMACCETNLYLDIYMKAERNFSPPKKTIKIEKPETEINVCVFFIVCVIFDLIRVFKHRSQWHVIYIHEHHPSNHLTHKSA